eukprot:s1774_g2.t2
MQRTRPFTQQRIYGMGFIVIVLMIIFGIHSAFVFIVWGPKLWGRKGLCSQFEEVALEIMAPLTTVRGFPTQPMQAWGAPSNKEVVPSSTFMEPEDYPENVKEIIRQVQAYIFTRRIRVKEIFLDFDPLRCGRCTPHQFVRGLNSVAPQLTASQMRILTVLNPTAPEEYLKQYGISVEEHFVLTNDNYILRMFRLPRPNAPVALLQHGVLASSWCWLVNTPDKSLGIVLWRMGYDVWLTNSRGNTFSRNHTESPGLDGELCVDGETTMDMQRRIKQKWGSSFLCGVTFGVICEITVDVICGRQFIDWEHFGRFDYGNTGNIEHYGTADVPLYNLTNLQMPTALFMGSKDTLADPEDVKRLMKDLEGNDHVVYSKEYEDYSHLTWMVGLTDEWIDDLKVLLKQYNPVTSMFSEDFYSDSVQDLMKPQVVRHLEFIRAVDGVFGGFELEKQPIVKVPRPGHCLKKHGDDISPCDDEAAVEQTLRRLALLVKTRGVIFDKCFQDAERSLDTSLLCPRYSGKVTEAQFCSHFPFMQDISDYELTLILQRYYNSETAGINYVAMDKDLQALIEEPFQDSSYYGSAKSTCSGRPTPRSVVKGGNAYRLPSPQETDPTNCELKPCWLMDDEDDVEDEDDTVADYDVEDDDVEDDEVKEDYVEDDEVADDDVEDDDVEEDVDDNAEDEVQDGDGVLAKSMYKVSFRCLLARSVFETSVEAFKTALLARSV